MKLLIHFFTGQYSSLKVNFKAIFSKKFKWNGSGWYGNGGYVEPTEKMETGMAVTFRVDCQDDLGIVFAGFCKDNAVKFEAVDGFEEVKAVGMTVDDLDKVGEVKGGFLIDRVTMFREEAKRRGFSGGFIDRWSELLKADDDRLNAKVY